MQNLIHKDEKRALIIISAVLIIAIMESFCRGNASKEGNVKLSPQLDYIL